MPINSAQKGLDRVFGATLRLLARVAVFNNVAKSGLSIGAEKEMEKTKQFLIQMDSSQEMTNFFADKQGELIKDSQSTVENAINSACIVYAHGILDACVYGYLTVTSLACPDSWEPWVSRKQVELLSTKTKTYEQLRNNKIKDFLKKSVEHNSLLYKVETLHKIAPPTQKLTEVYNTYDPDRNRLEKFDDARHRIVHGNDWGFYIFDFTDEFAYWSFLNAYFVGLIANKTGLKITHKSFTQLI